MTEWPIVQLASVLDRLETGKRPRGGAINTGIPSIGGEHVRPDGSVATEVQTFIPPDFFLGLSKGVLRDGDILIVKDGATTGKTGIYSDSNGIDVAINEHVFLLRCDESKCHQRFAFHMLRTPHGNRMILSDFRGAAQGGISREFASKVRFRLPSLHEQQRIVELLDRAAEIRRRADAARAKARAIIPALFLDTFGDPGANPNNWPTVRLGELLERIDGGWSPKCGERVADDSHWGVLKLSAVKATGFDGSEAKALLDEAQARPELEVCDGDLLFTRKNTIELVGTAAIVRDKSRRRMLPDTIFRLVPAKPPRFHAEYIDSLLNLTSFRPKIRALASGSASSMPGISKERLRSLVLPLPPLTLQYSFAEQVKRMRSLASGLAAASATAEAMAAALSAEVFEAPPVRRDSSVHQEKPEPEQAAAD